MTATVIDSSGWLSFFAGDGNADVFEKAILAADPLIVPSVCLTEVLKILLRQVPKTEALRAIAQMRLGEVVDLDGEIALLAATVGVEQALPLADSIIYATALKQGATVWTQDADFDGLPQACYVKAAKH